MTFGVNNAIINISKNTGVVYMFRKIKEVLNIETKEDLKLAIIMIAVPILIIIVLFIGIVSLDKGIPSGYEITINNGVYKVDNYVIYDNQVIFTVEVEGQQREYKVSKDIVEIKPVR